MEILWADYPVLWVLLWSAIFSICCFKIAKFILLGRGAESSADSAKCKIARRISHIFAESTLLLAIIAVDIIGIRGGVGTFPLREDEHHIDANPLINHIATNPILAFVWAYSHYERRDIFAKIDAKQLAQMQIVRKVEQFEIPTNKIEFFNKYDALNKAQLDFRVNE